MLADEHRFFSLRGETLERRFTRKGDDSTAYDLQAWYGTTYNKAVVKAEGDIAKGKLEESRTELLWGTPSHRTGTPSSAFGWITGKARAVNGWLSASRASPLLVRAGGDGLRGKWWTYGAACRRQLRAAADPATDSGASRRVAVLWQGRPERGIGKGLAEASAGLRLRYEFSRQFAPISAWNGRAASDAPRTMCVPKAAVRSRRAGWLACDSGSRT